MQDRSRSTSSASAKLLAESPNTEPHKDQGKKDKRCKTRPQFQQRTSLDHYAAADRTKMADRIEKCERLEPLRHSFNRRQCSRKRCQGWIDKEAQKHCLLRRTSERRNKCADPDTA